MKAPIENRSGRIELLNAGIVVSRHNGSAFVAVAGSNEVYLVTKDNRKEVLGGKDAPKLGTYIEAKELPPIGCSVVFRVVPDPDGHGHDLARPWVDTGEYLSQGGRLMA